MSTFWLPRPIHLVRLSALGVLMVVMSGCTLYATGSTPREPVNSPPKLKGDFLQATVTCDTRKLTCTGSAAGVVGGKRLDAKLDKYSNPGTITLCGQKYCRGGTIKAMGTSDWGGSTQNVSFSGTDPYTPSNKNPTDQMDITIGATLYHFTCTNCFRVYRSTGV